MYYSLVTLFACGYCKIIKAYINPFYKRKLSIIFKWFSFILFLSTNPQSCHIICMLLMQNY